MSIIVAGGQRRAIVAILNARLAGFEREWLEGQRVLGGSDQATCQVLASCRNWTDGNNAGFSLAAGAGNAKILAATLPAHALSDGGYLEVACTGSYTGSAANRTLLFKLQAWTNFFSGSGTAVYLGPTAAGNPGWGFANSQTGTGLFTASGRFLFVVRLRARGYQAAAQIFADGQIEVGPVVARDGGIQTPLTGRQTYKIWNDGLVLDTTKEYELTLDVGLNTGGGETITVDGADMVLVGGRTGFDVYT